MSESSIAARPSDPPLFVDLDGTLLKTDLLLEYLAAASSKPGALVAALLTLPQGKSQFKQALVDRVALDVSVLPRNEEVLRFLEEQKSQGRKIVLATASNAEPAQRLADELGLFDDVLASDKQTNLKGARKLIAIQEYCRSNGGGEDFDYVGDSAADLPIWKQARRCYAVSPSPYVKSRLGNAETTYFSEKSGILVAALRCLRPHQWVKNFLVFLPLIMAHDPDVAKWGAAALAFFAFSLVASSVYVVNDVIDVQADRQHPKKKRRPFASGDLPMQHAPLLAVALIAAGFLAGFSVSLGFLVVLCAYLATTSLYSTYLKRKVLVDVLTLAGLYSLRVFAGGVAVGLMVSEWLTAFCFFFFTSLAFAKRFAEFERLARENQVASPSRGYLTQDLDLLSTLGACSGALSVLVLALYINSRSAEVYESASGLWLLCPLTFYWIGRVWLRARRGQLNEDPIVFAFRDRVSLICGAIAGMIWAVASWVPASWLALLDA